MGSQTYDMFVKFYGSDKWMHDYVLGAIEGSGVWRASSARAGTLRVFQIFTATAVTVVRHWRD